MLIERTRIKYRTARERANFNITDIEFELRSLAEEGLLCCILGMDDLTRGEEILVQYYLNQYQEEQVFDIQHDLCNPLIMASLFSSL